MRHGAYHRPSPLDPKAPALERACSGRAPRVPTRMDAGAYAAFAGTGAFTSAGLISMRIA